MDVLEIGSVSDFGWKGRNIFFIHLGTLKGANISYGCSGCPWKKL